MTAWKRSMLVALALCPLPALAGPPNEDLRDPAVAASEALAKVTARGVPAALVAPPAALGTILLDSGPIVTHPGGGAGGADASRLQNNLTPPMNVLGFGSAASANISLADDFVVPTGETWNIDTMTFFAYQTGSTTTSTLNLVHVQIYNGPPNAGGTVIFGDLTTNRIASTNWTNAYRETMTTPGTTRPIMAAVATVDTTLTEGTYWVEYRLGGTLASGPFCPPITILGQTTTGNGLQFNLGAWAPITDFGPTGNEGQGLKFVIEGTSTTAGGFIRGDFNSDGQTDILWRHDESGENVLWYMNGVTLAGGEFTTPAALEDVRWKMVGTHDFNADGQNDILWRHNVAGENVLWYMNGSVLVSGEFLTPASLPDTNWQMAGTGDFDGDGGPDIAWHHQVAGQVVLWFMNGSVLESGTFTTPPSMDLNYRLVGVADFSNPLDGHPDFVWRNQVTGENLFWLMNGATQTASVSTNTLSDIGWALVATGDFNLDQKNDFIWRHQTSGQNVAWFMNGTAFVSGTFLDPPDFPDVRWKMVGPR
jgi:hypothetical protein